MILLMTVAGSVYLLPSFSGAVKDSRIRSTGVVFEADRSEYSAFFDVNIYQSDDMKYETDDYVLSDIELITENTDELDTSVFGQAKLSYDENEYQIEDVLRGLEDTGLFIHVEEDDTLYADARIPGIISGTSDMNNTNQWYLDTIGARDAWNTLDEEPGKGVVVAVIDTGVDYTHKELKNNMWINETEASGRSGYDDDGNGIIDDIYGANFSADNKDPLKKGDPYDTDEEGHGTHVAGIIAMEQGNGGCCGIAYGCRIMAVKAGGTGGSFKVSAVISSLDYALNMGANVINMSFGTYSESSVLKSMLERVADKCVLVAAAGNDGYVTTDLQSENSHDVYPAAYPCVIGVMATDRSNIITQWSNYDHERYTDVEYEIAAPGYSILSSMPSGKYAYMNGTSMATPMVSGAAAVLYGIIDRDKLSAPALYVYGQLTQATGHTASKTDDKGNSYTYPLLNLYDSLVSMLKGNEGVSLNINKFNYYCSSGSSTFDRSVEIGDYTAVINCGFRISNMWSEVDNISVNVKAESELCKNDESEVDIAYMPAVSSITVSCQSMETYSFEFACNANGTYDIPIVYSIKATYNGKTYTGEFRDVITIKVNKAEGNATTSANTSDNSQNTSQNAVTQSISGASSSGASSTSKVGAPAKVKITRITKIAKKVYKNTLKWKSVSGAKKYVVYYSKKKHGTYTMLGVTSATKYTHTYKKNRTYYYKVRAYTVSKGKKIYGKYSSIIKIGK